MNSVVQPLLMVVEIDAAVAAVWMRDFWISRIVRFTSAISARV
jgi:hypothetical protein